MSDSDLDQVLSGEVTSDDIQPTVEPVEEPAEPAEEPEATAEEPEPAAEPEPQPSPEPEMVPVKVVADLRKELRELKEAALAKDPEPAPDFFEDPTKAMQHHLAPVQDGVNKQMLRQSKFFAEREFGADLVEKALAYYDQNPQQSHTLKDHPSPFHAAVEGYQQAQVANEIGGDPQAYIAKLRETLTAEIKADLVAEAAKNAAANVAPSLAQTTGTGGGVKTSWAGPTPLGNVLPD